MSPALEMADNPGDDRYEVRLDGQVVGRADYRLDGQRVVIAHTYIHPAHRGQGLGAQMVQYALNDIRRRGLDLVPACPFVSDYVAQHPEYADLL
jgi:predicted GNAT family acetyltransferase